MPTFKVVLDGIELSEEQSSRISKSIQRSVLLELAELDTGADNVRKPDTFGFALLPIGVGQTDGMVATDPPDPKRIDEIVASEFGA
jgi:hypothetical protein